MNDNRGAFSEDIPTPENLLRAIVESSDDAIVSKDLNSNVTSWNKSAERMFGYTAEEIVGQSVLRLIPADRRDEEPEILERLRRGERVDHFETIRVRKDGEQFPVSLTISPVRNPEGKIVGASKIARDITGLKQAAREREALLASEREARALAERANRMKDEFLTTVSHELRTPLNAIVGWTDLLANGGSDREEVVYGIDVIRKNAMMQAQLIHDLLDLGRITSGKMALKLDRVDLRSIVSEAIKSVQPAADAKCLFLRPELGEFRAELGGDAKRLQQVVWNLLTNAIKFTEAGGSVDVTLARFDSCVELTVADTGRGIAPQFLPHLFERFRQADASATRLHGGLGIGLALVKELVELHGGRVRAESPGTDQGATFVVTVPVTATEAAGSDPTLGNAKSGAEAGFTELSGIRVLIVDDDRDSLEVVQRILCSRGAEIRSAGAVAEAMEILRTYSPDIILSDISMPHRDGYEFIRHLRDQPFFAGIPAVALTALARVEDRARALDSGFQSHLAKPLSAAELVAVVRSFGKLRPVNASEPEVMSR